MSNKTAQELFDEKYITSSEIQKMMGVERSSILNARRRGMLPDPIIVRGVRAFIWERENVTPYLEAWKIALASRRGELA
jgi:hypothetical protein